MNKWHGKMVNIVNRMAKSVIRRVTYQSAAFWCMSMKYFDWLSANGIVTEPMAFKFWV